MTIRIRSLERGEIPDLVRLWNATMSADPISEQRLMLDFVLDSQFDPASLLVAASGDALVGFIVGMTARPNQPSDNAIGTGVVVGFGVHASWRRQGIGLQLVAALEHHWAGRDVHRIQVGPWVPTYLAPGVDEAAYPGTVEFLRACGFNTGSKPVSMRALLTGYKESDDVPGVAGTLEAEGITIRLATGDDAAELLAFANVQFPHWESYVRGALRSVVSATDTAILHIALDGDAIIGFALTNGERFGPFGVHADYRGRGVGAVLLSRALCAMRAANQHLAYFLWTSDQTARLYSRHGFEIVRRFTMMSK